MPIPIRMEHDFRLDVDELASLITPRTRMIVLNSPANPTGGVLTRGDLERIAELAMRHDLVVLADEIYGRILYDGTEHVSIASLPGMAERTIVLDGFSKTFAMTGWRLGYAIVPPSLVETYGQLDHQHDQLRADVRPGRRRRGAARAAGRRSTRWSSSSGPAAISSSTGSTRSRASAASGRPGRSTRSRTSPGTGLTGAELADRLLQEAGVCVLAGHGVRRRRAGPHPDLVRQLPREPGAGAASGSGRSWSRSSPPVRVASAGAVTRPTVFVARRIPDEGIEPLRGDADADRLAGRAAAAARRSPPRDRGLRRRS